MLVQEYIREIGACLIQLEQKQDLITQHLMEKLTVESSRLIGLIKLLNHDVHQAMLDGKLDPNLANTHKLGSAFYTNLTVWPLSSAHAPCLSCAFALASWTALPA